MDNLEKSISELNESIKLLKNVVSNLNTTLVDNFSQGVNSSITSEVIKLREDIRQLAESISAMTERD